MVNFKIIFIELMLILALLSIGVANATDDGIYEYGGIRSPVISSSSDIVITPENFSGFWYDIDDNIGSETLTIYDIHGRTIEEDSLFYRSSTVQVEYEADFASEDSSSTGDTYPVISLFGDTYIPTSDDDAGELVNLLLDTDDKYTLRVGSTLEFPNGYQLTITDIDVNSYKASVELSKNGELIENEVIDASVGKATWDYTVDVGTQDNVLVFRLLITDIFQGQVDSLVVIEGLWLLDYEDIMEIESTDEFGVLEVRSVSDSIVMANPLYLSLGKGETVNLAEDLKFKVADDDELRFYLMKECPEYGPYNLTGNIATGPASWTAQNFSGFMYDLDNDLGSETLTISDIDDRNIEEDFLVYNTSIVQADYAAEFDDEDTSSFNDTYPVLGLFGEKYVSLSDRDASELVQLLVDSSDGHTLRTGSVLDLPNGYELTVNQINVSDKLVRMVLAKDNMFIMDVEIDVMSGESTWDYAVDVGSHDDVIVSRVHVSEVSDDHDGSFVVVDGVYLIDYQDILSIEAGDKFGELVVDSVSDTIVMSNYGAIVLLADDVIQIAPYLYLQVANASELRYYPFIEVYNDQVLLEIESFSPSTTTGYESTSQLFQISLNQIANITWFLDYVDVQVNSSSTSASYCTLPPAYGKHTVTVLASNENNSVVREWEWLVQKDPVVVDSLELRSSVISSLSDIVITSQNFSGFWYDFDDGIGSEVLTISSIQERTIPKGKLCYNSSIVQVEYEADFANENSSSTNYTYPVIGLFGDKYIPTSDDDAGEFVPLLIDTDDKYTLRTGSALELPNGYELTAKDIDVEGDTVHMELSKDGEFIVEKTIDATVGEATWDYTVNVGSQKNVIAFRVLITDVFQGQVDSLAVVEGLWLLDYDDIFVFEPADEFGELKVNSISDTIVMTNYEPLNLSMGETVYLAEDMKFKVANDEDLRFYLMNECTELGTYSLRGDVAIGPSVWTAHNFAGFMYDFDDGISSEALSIFNIYGRVIEEEFLIYNTSIVQVDYEANFASEDSSLCNDTYPALGLFGEKYVSLSDTDSGELVKLLIDSNDNHTLRTGSILELPNGYTLTAKQIEVEDDKVWLELSKDDEFIEDEVIYVTTGEATWDYDVDIGSHDDVIVSRVHVSGISQDSEGSFVVVDGLYLIDYQTILSIKSGDEFGELEVDSVSDTIVMRNSGTIFLLADDVIEIAPGLHMQVADDSELRYYPFVEYEIIKSVPNQKPTAIISSISPNPATEGESISFSGIGTDSDGTVTGYNWRSSLDGWLSSSDSFSTSRLSAGAHTIYFMVQDDSGYWSDEVSASVTVVDQTSPVFMLTTSQYNNTHRKVSVTASESIIGSPVVEVNSELINMTLESGKWIGYFPIDADSLFAVNVTGTDLAGNIGDSTSTIRIETISYENGQCKFNSSESGMSITFNGTNGTTGTMTVTESEDPMVNLINRSIGLYFLNVELDDILAGNMSGAMIAIPVDSLVLPDGMDKEDVSICYYNESTENWDSCPTSIEMIDGIECWTTYVTHFSMYGVIASDTVSPVLESVIPASGSTFAKDTTSVDIRFNFSDAQTGINVSSIVFDFDGNIVNNSLEITGSYASYTATNLSSGSYTASVTVADMADNSVVFSTTFTIASDPVTSSGGSSGSSGGGGGGGTTGEKYENVLVKEVESIFVNKDSHISYEFNEEGNAISSVGFDSLKNSGTISTIVEVLKSRSSFADSDAPGIIYQQMNIWVGKSGFVTPENVENLMITFKVEKSWLEGNNIEAGTVYLYRYADGSWNALPTSITEEDADFVYFESQTPGFSPFAIGSEAEVVEIADESSLESVDDENVEGTTVEDTGTESESSSFTGILVALGGISVLLIGAFVVYKKRS
ncbi:S-layer protein domain-containing protein [uncultured Methanolobus sp.]|uniref:S-layer protein domain-containing protein n=1 Tax=uncultured Methanolobus sp. TaxID=218300 RepID=UPI002AAB3171|nr:S-layer protein domain-containing protein [uncultured Methanolobus sp.]